MAHTRMVFHFLGFPARAERAKAKPADHATDQSKCTLQGTVRAECLDWTLIQGRRHLERVLRTYV
jgi:hypothetical protein